MIASSGDSWVLACRVKSGGWPAGPARRRRAGRRPPARASGSWRYVWPVRSSRSRSKGRGARPACSGPPAGAARRPSSSSRSFHRPPRCGCGCGGVAIAGDDLLPFGRDRHYDGRRGAFCRSGDDVSWRKRRLVQVLHRSRHGTAGSFIEGAACSLGWTSGRAAPSSSKGTAVNSTRRRGES